MNNLIKAIEGIKKEINEDKDSYVMVTGTKIAIDNIIGDYFDNDKKVMLFKLDYYNELYADDKKIVFFPVKMESSKTIEE